jgi:transcriptional regulator with XRE-family HTH domain
MIDDDLLYIEIGKKIRQFREQRNLTQEELGKTISVSRASIANYENSNQAIYISDLYKIADAFGIDVGDILPSLKEIKSKSQPEALLDQAKDLKAYEKKQIKELIEKAE